MAWIHFCNPLFYMECTLLTKMEVHVGSQGTFHIKQWITKVNPGHPEETAGVLKDCEGFGIEFEKGMGVLWRV